MKSTLTAFALILLSFGQSFGQDTLLVCPDLILVKISSHVYVHTSWFASEEWGRFPSNGMLVVNKGEAILFDTPMSDSLTDHLIHFAKDSLHLKIKWFVANHFHNDCTEGLDVVKAHDISTIGHEMTNLFLVSSRELTEYSFRSDYKLNLKGLKVKLHYPGPAHTQDNTVAWIRKDKVLFAGCMSKSAGSRTLGNTADANLKKWPETIGKVRTRYKGAKIVIPGHGPWGGLNLLDHTLELLSQ